MHIRQEAEAIPAEAYTISTFCRAFGVSRSSLYEFWKEKMGPKVFYVGSSPRISKQAALDWVRSMEREADPKPRKSKAA